MNDECLKVVIPAGEQYDEVNDLFCNETKEQTLTLKHSLVSLAKWEARWHRPFLGKERKTYEETVDYIRCMTVTQNVDPMVYNYVPQSVIEEVDRYIDEPMTATTFNDDKKTSNQIVTAEIIYYWMTALNIPFSCEKWHLNRLLALIRVCSLKNSPGKKMSRREITSRNKALNQARRKKYKTRG